ncbi:MAG: response regulator transcription factor [Methylococcaceae bacterium]|nr:MAG: response regulator transcription factor [Methylococcaceae bacterium]
MIRLLIADDHPLIRQELKLLLAPEQDMVVSAEAENGAQVLELLGSGAYELLLLDLTMPGLPGPELITRVRALHGELRILVMSMHNEPQIARSALWAGANGYVAKDCEPEILLTAIRRVARGERFIDPALQSYFAGVKHAE